MKVYELIGKLIDLPAGMEIAVTDRPDGWLNDLTIFEIEADMVFLKGDGIASEENAED